MIHRCDDQPDRGADQPDQPDRPDRGADQPDRPRAGAAGLARRGVGLGAAEARAVRLFTSAGFDVEVLARAPAAAAPPRRRSGRRAA
jgi:hypothetical protein